MGRKAKPRVPSAGEVVSFFEEMPLAFAELALDIITSRVERRRHRWDEDPATLKAALDGPVGPKRGRKAKAEPTDTADH
jgi:hypothetical protein